MASDSKDIVVRTGKNGDAADPAASPAGELTTRGQQAGGFLEKAFSHLPAEKQQELVTEAIKARIQLDEKSEQAQRINEQSRDEMENAVNHVRQLSRSQLGFTHEHEGKTASGSWRTEVSKSNATLIIAIVAIVSLALAIVFSR